MLNDLQLNSNKSEVVVFGTSSVRENEKSHVFLDFFWRAGIDHRQAAAGPEHFDTGRYTGFLDF